MASIWSDDSRRDWDELAASSVMDGESGSGIGEYNDERLSTVYRALRKSHQALARIRVSALRSVKSLIRNRVPAQNRLDMEFRYAELLRRVALVRDAVDAAIVTMAAPSPTTMTTLPVMVTLLADVYRLEKELNDTDEERDRLSASGGGADGVNALGTRHSWFGGWFA